MNRIITKAVVAIVAAVAIVAPGVASAYDQAEYTANGQPQFNTYTSAQGYGSEKDFLRVGPAGGSGSQFANKYDVCEGEAQLNVYIHNGAPEGYNGTNNTGTGVAKDTKLNIKIAEGYGKTFNPTAVISASNAATVSDGATISCDGHEVKLEYVKGSAKIGTFDGTRTNAPLNDAVVNGGTLIGHAANNGVVPGCWDYRIYVTLKVKVTKKPVEQKNPAYACELLKVVKLAGREVRISEFNHSERDGAVYKTTRINWGDGTTSEAVNPVGQTHTYAQDGNYNIVATAVFTVDGKEVTDSGAECQQAVNYTSVTTAGTTPTVTPTELPRTGAGSVAGIVAATTFAGASAHRVVTRRRG